MFTLVYKDSTHGACSQYSHRMSRNLIVIIVVYYGTIVDVIYYYVIWSEKGSTLPEANTRRQRGKYPMIKLRGCILKLSLYSVNSVLILYRTGNMQSAILLSFVTSSSTALQASIYPPADALLYQSIQSSITSIVRYTLFVAICKQWQNYFFTKKIEFHETR